MSRSFTFDAHSPCRTSASLVRRVSDAMLGERDLVGPGPIVGVNTAFVHLSRFESARWGAMSLGVRENPKHLGLRYHFACGETESGTAERKARGRIHRADASPA